MIAFCRMILISCRGISPLHMFRRILLSSASFLCTFAFVAQTEAANRYWVGTDNRWEKTANWAATSGGAGGQTVPGSSDIAIFDGGGSSDVILRSAVSLQGLLLASTTGKTVSAGTGSFVIGSSNLRVGAGTLRMSGRPLRVTDSITQTGGFILEMSSTVSLSGSLSLSSDATFVATGTLIFSGNANQTFGVTQNVTLIVGDITLRNTGSAGSNKVIVNCVNVYAVACGIGNFAPSTNMTVTSGQLDLATSSNTLILLDGGITVANNSLASVNVGNGGIIMSGSLLVGSAGSISFGADGNITFSGTGTMTVNLNGASAMYSFSVVQQESVEELNGCPNLTLASNILSDDVVLIGQGCTLNLSSYTLAATGATFINIGTINAQTGRVVTAASGFAVQNSAYSSTLTSVSVGNNIYFTITDAGRNLVASALTGNESLNITLTTAEGDSETLSLDEVATSGALGVAAIYGVFRDAIGTTVNPSITQNDGILQLTSASTTVTATYTDPYDGLSNTTSVLLTTSSTGGSSSSSTTGGGGGGGRRVLPSATGSTSSNGSSSSASSASSASQSSSSSARFTDVPSSSWFASFVEALTKLGIVSGYKDTQGNSLHEFRPENAVTYAEIAKMAAEAAGLSSFAGASMNTSDDGQWSEGYIALMESQNVSVFQNHALDVNTSAPRGAVVQILLQLFHTELTATANPYSDLPLSSPFAGAILQATFDGIVSGDDGKSTFRPNDSVNRAETAKMVMKAMEQYGE